jgi:hypothetical protein
VGQSNGKAASEHVGHVLSLIAERDLEGLRPALALLTDKERREAAKAVGDWSRTLREERDQISAEFARTHVKGAFAPHEWPAITWNVACVAVIGTFSAPAAAATVLQRVARLHWLAGMPADLMIVIARERGLDWLPDLAGRLADRLGDYQEGWGALDQILRAYQAPAPPGDGFVLGWLASVQPRYYSWPRSPDEVAELVGQQADWLQASPYLPDLLPKVFEIDGTWRALENGPIWRPLLELSRREPGYRPQLIDGCLNRILLGGTAPALHPFGLLWAELAPDDSEVAARVAAYTAVAASAPPGLATRALKALNALGHQGKLGLDDLLDLSAAVLARREKALVNAQLQVLARAVRQHPERLQDILTAVEPATQHGVPEVRTAAARILREHAADVTPGVGEKLTAAAVAAEADVRAERAASAINFSSAGELPALPRPAAAQPLSRVPVDAGGLLEERLNQLEELPWSSAGASWAMAMEPVLDGLVRLVPGDALELVLPRISVRLTRRDLPPLTTLAGELAAGRCGDPALLVKCGITRLRIGELAGRLGTDPVPRLVAVPTDTSGVIDPLVLLERLSAAEAEGWDPWPLDLDQALLRTARRVPTELASKAGVLTSAAGGRLARWWSRESDDEAAWDGLIGVLLSRDSDPGAVAAPTFTYAPVSHWLAALPYHHEAAARWLSPLLPQYAWDTWRWLMTEDDMVRLLLGADRLGPGLHAVLASCLGAPSYKAREAATAVLAARLASSATDAAALGAGLGGAFASGQASLDRALEGVEQVIAAQPEQMWPVVTAALPAVMAARPARAFRLAQIASDLAGHLGRTATIPGLAEAARLKSKLGQAARELSSTMSGAPQ